ncbi:hypothetical protein M3Y99_00646100 [Aphelenchoides fujianensis]|nr:hypothetical protein M3Y99_00646100 [Aphelenchoides fujianensis]
MDFGTRPTRKPCAMCPDPIEITCEKVLMHRRCFTCEICDVQLSPGSCSRDDGLIYLQFMTSKNRPMLGSGEKYEALKAKYGQGQALQSKAR